MEAFCILRLVKCIWHTGETPQKMLLTIVV